MIKNILILIISTIILPACAFDYDRSGGKQKHVSHRHSESSYQHAWCRAHFGVEEYLNPDFTRVDCLTEGYAVEFDFANKWAESIGQALHYQLMAGKRGKVVLILENPEKETVYFKRVMNLAKIYNFDIEYVTDEILDIQNGKCKYQDCKCNKSAYNKQP